MKIGPIEECDENEIVPNVDPADLIGQIIEKIETNKESREVWFYTKLHIYRLYHETECCEYVDIVDCDVDLSMIKNEQVISCTFEYGQTPADKENIIKEHVGKHDSYTWQFFKMTTNKNCFTICIFGTSNGWYRETMQMDRYNRITIQ